MKYNETLGKAYIQIGELRNEIKERVKRMMGWSADAPFYDRIYGRIKCTPAEQQAFLHAFSEVVLRVSTDFAEKDLFPAKDFKPATVE